MKNSPDRDLLSTGNANDYRSNLDYVLFQNLKQLREYARKRLYQNCPLSLDEIHDKDLRLRDIFDAGRKLNMSERLLTLLVLSPAVT